MTSSATTNWDSLILGNGVVKPTEKVIGGGAYGKVFEVNYEGTLCAAKEVHALLLQYAQGDDFQKIKDDFLNECQIWSTLRHPCVVQFLGVYYPATDQYRLPVIVMEKMQHSLRDLVEKYDNIPLSVKLSILDEVCLGLRYLHSRNPPIVHRDLTPNNILLSYRLEAKITDLGVAKVVRDNNQKTMTTLPGTPDFMPPEAQSIRPVYGPSLDVFSYGGVILNVSTQLWPQPTDRNQYNPDTDVWETVPEVKRRQKYLDKMTGGAADLKPLVTACLNDNPKKRPPVAQVSMTIKRVKDVCSQKSSRDGMSPIVWLAEVSNEQSEVTSSLEQLSRENDVLKTDVTQLRTNNDAMKNEIGQLKDEVGRMKYENKQLTTLLDKMAVNNESQIQQINFLSSENATMKDEINQLKSRIDRTKVQSIELKTKVDDLKASLVDTSRSPHPLPVTHRKHKLKQPVVMKESTTIGDLFSGPVNIEWEEGTPAPVTRAEHTAVWLNGLVYVGGGLARWNSSRSFTINYYDPINNSWSSPIGTPYCLFALTTFNHKLLIAGGEDKDGKRTNQIFLMDVGHFNDYTKMNTARSDATATGHQGMLIITGGKDDKHNLLSSTELFDSTNEQWYMCDDLPQPHRSLKSVIVNNVLYLLGGFNKDGASPAVFTAPLDSLLRRQLKWNTHQDTPPCCLSTPVSIHGTQLLIVGGRKKTDGYSRTFDVYMFNKISHSWLSWEAIGYIPSARDRLAAVSAGDNRVIVIGGYNDQGDYTNTVWIGSCKPQLNESYYS